MQPDRRNLASLVDDFERAGSDIAIVERRGVRHYETTYAGLAQLVRRFAAELDAREIHKGDRVLIWGENGAEWVAAFVGSVLRGVLPVPLDFASTVEFAQRVANDVTPKLIVGDRDKLDSLGTGVTLAFGDFNPTLTTRIANAIDDLSEDDALQIVFTSGTTGTPKGVVHTHGNVLASLRPIEHEARKYRKYERLFHPVRILHTLPLSHVFGQFMGLWVPAIFALEVHYESRLVASDMVERIHDLRISGVAAVPRILELMQNYVLSRYPSLNARLERAGKMSAWQRWWEFREVHRLFGLKFWAFICGGASLSPAAEQFWTALGFVVVQGYGMTETTALISLNHPFHPASGTTGQVLPGREVRLSDEGEVLVRGATISDKVWEQGALRREGSEWLATGDLAEFDARGNLRFRGRKKDVIVTSAGLNIYPEDLEAALARQPGVKASTVVETASAHGPEPVAALVMAIDYDPAAVISAVNQQLAEFQRIQRWVVWPEPDLPRTSTGKISRREVARRIASGEIESASDAGSLNGDLKLDSLGRVQLQARLEQEFGISLDDAAIQQVATAEDVRKLVAATPAGAAQPAREAERHIYPQWPWAPLVYGIRSAFLELIAMPLTRFLAKPKLIKKHIDWPLEPMLIVANHATSYDPAFVFYALPGRIRCRTAVAMAGELLYDFRTGRNQGNWFLNALTPIAYVLITALFNVFPLPQFSGFRRSFAHAGEAMDRGYNVLVFPEGRRADDETPQPFKAGAGILWQELGAPALTVRLHGLGEIKARDGRWFRSGKISVSVGDVVPLPSGKSPEELAGILERAVFSQ